MPSRGSKPTPKHNAPPHVSWRFEAIGTQWEIELYEALEQGATRTLKRHINECIRRFDKTYSRFRSDSFVAEVAAKAGRYPLPYGAKPLLDLYTELYQFTGGKMTPLIGQQLADAGYDKSYSLKSKPLTAIPNLNDVLRYDDSTLIVTEPVLLDFGAVGKGYLVDLVSGIIERAGAQEYCVDAGGDMRVRAALRRPLAVGLEHPTNPGQVVGVAQLENGSLCGSAGNRRAWGKYHHILDPHTRSSPRHLEAVWVAASTTMLADALTTALFFAPPARLAQTYRFDYALMYANGSLKYSQGFPSSFF